MSIPCQLWTVTPQGKRGRPLPDKRNVQYLDDNDDVGSLVFDYLVGGTHADIVEAGEDEFVEVMLIAPGFDIPNNIFTIKDSKGNKVVDGKRYKTWNCPSYLDRLDEVLVVADKDTHLREDVRTAAEQRELEEAREEWMAQQIREAIDTAKDRAKEHNDKVRDRRNKTDSGGQGGDPSDASNRRGAKAIRWAYNQIDNPSQNWYRMCQSFVRQSFGLPGIYATANEAWFAGLKRGATPVNDTPAGVPVYWGPNHVALSVGNGQCISTDVLRAGQVDEVPIASLHNGVHWNLTYRGWSPEVSGRRIFP